MDTNCIYYHNSNLLYGVRFTETQCEEWSPVFDVALNERFTIDLILLDDIYLELL